MADYGPGMIGLACGELGRYSDFVTSMMGLQRPPGTVFMKGTGLGPAYPFNGIAKEFLKDKTLEWLFLTNDDNLCPPDTIPRLLDHNVDVVSGLYFGRFMPFEPILFDRMEYKQVTKDHLIGDNKTNIPQVGRWYYRHLMEPGERGLVPAIAVGDGCLMIRRRVMEKLVYPWWEYGETHTDMCDHDVVFSRKVREAGFGLYCDLDLIVDHITSIAVRPHRKPDGTWVTQLVQGGENRTIELPAAHKGMIGSQEPK